MVAACLFLYFRKRYFIPCRDNVSLLEKRVNPISREVFMSTTDHQFGFTTRQLHSGYDPEVTTGSRAIPIYQTTAYDLQSTDRAARLFALQETGNIYSRISNPTSNVFETRIADLEGAV